ncbi:unnamed protein product [Angiostrongylus costaricensis]|uniref:DUF5753 domain-containing protein n=1 Tax=Angiostrongylus costaricensis TaxID=334426 RepID=A0A0R3PLG1_ANGCS|nr:unnamed protein product [Angiostrongylus costaricensis]
MEDLLAPARVARRSTGLQVIQVTGDAMHVYVIPVISSPLPLYSRDTQSCEYSTVAFAPRISKPYVASTID